MDAYRKKTLILFVLVIILFLSLLYTGLQIPWSRMVEPGPLCMSHESLYRPGGCKLCHSEGHIVDNQKCLPCHSVIMERIRRNAGLHARVTTECAYCHSEHHGRNHDLIKLDVETFDHHLTGWPLEGSHALLRCTACHGIGSYLLYKTRCIDCHRDFHLGQLGPACDACHGKNSFRIADYRHKESERSPQERHLNLQCNECHRMEYGNYPSGTGLTTRYKGTDFTCTRCHEDVHDGENGPDCLECHNQKTFTME